MEIIHIQILTSEAIYSWRANNHAIKSLLKAACEFNELRPRQSIA